VRLDLNLESDISEIELDSLHLFNRSALLYVVYYFRYSDSKGENINIKFNIDNIN